MKILKSYKAAFLLIVLVVFAFASMAGAQNARKKRKATTRAVQTQTLPAPTTEPVIISRAEDYPLGDVGLSPAIESALRSADQTENNPDEKTITELTGRIKALEAAQKDDYDVKQKRLAMRLLPGLQLNRPCGTSVGPSGGWPRLTSAKGSYCPSRRPCSLERRCSRARGSRRSTAARQSSRHS